MERDAQPSLGIDPAYARGAWAVLATFALFQVVSLGEAVLVATSTFAVGGRGIGALAAVRVAVVLLGLAARAALLLRALRPPTGTRLAVLQTWQPVALTILALVATVATQGVYAFQPMLYEVGEGREALTRMVMVTGLVSAAGHFAGQVVMIVAMWIAFVRGRDIALGPDGPRAPGDGMAP